MDLLPASFTAGSQAPSGPATTLPAGRAGHPRELAAGYLFLIDNPFVTGAVIDIDGGSLIQ